ncbi:hypothetical protein G5714_016171 [Onychostoma macrolepis]|uniref:Uncharacterized protein n=1 Tax=Onychostoma macrolepis TaxID=369639 RepID=A0A7J6C7M9_9TELE|nr:hypothetical protein G5714_016171 [Onychostoma macrolepis]
MKAVLVVAVLLCIVLSSEASDVLQCTGERLSDGQFYFNMSYDVKEDVRDCETQWLVDEKVAGISDDEGNMTFISPIVMATLKTAILQMCPERLECLLICPTGNINEKQQCPCDASPPTTLPEVGFPNWRVYIYIVGAFAVLVTVTVFIVLYWKRQRLEYAPAEQAV